MQGGRKRSHIYDNFFGSVFEIGGSPTPTGMQQLNYAQKQNNRRVK